MFDRAHIWGLLAIAERVARDRRTGAVLLLAAGVASAPGAAAPLRPQTDLDAFMQKVLAHRDENWKRLQQYILDERQEIQIRGINNTPLWGERRDFSWFIRDGYFVRSPVKVNGITVSETERRSAEAAFLAQAKAHEQRGRGGHAGAAGTQASDAAPADPQMPWEISGNIGAMLSQTRQPGFMDSAYFLRFKFEQGSYALVGRETLEGQDVLRVEYYPARLFSHEQDKEARQKSHGESTRDQQFDAEIERLMNKVSLVTLWVEPKAMQIVKYTFDNVNFDFFPAAWLVRVNDAKASMTMSRPIADQKDLWLPRDVDMYFAAMLAIGPFDVRYHLDYHDYKQASTSARMKDPEPR
jgi:hypothetical protein